MQGLLPRPTPRPDTKPAPRPVPKPAPAVGDPAQSKDKPTIAGALSVGAQHTDRFVEGQNVFTTGILQHTRGAKPYRALRTIKRLDPIYKGVGGALTIAEEGLGAIDDMNRGVPAQVAVPGAIMHGAGTLGAGAIVGGLVGSMLGPVGTVGGAMFGSWAADKVLPDREQLGKGFMKAYKAYGERPYYGIS